MQSKFNTHKTVFNLVDTGRKLNGHKTFRRRSGRLLNVLCPFNLRLVPTGKASEKYWSQKIHQRSTLGLEKRGGNSILAIYFSELLHLFSSKIPSSYLIINSVSATILS